MIVTRFAPSPTGYLHVGGLRTALYSYLWARKNGGKFLLRIEDTDLKRNSAEAAQAIEDAFAWVGLEHDGAVIYQSDRFPLYAEYIQKLLDSGHAYRCYMSKEELDALRESQMAAKERPRYDGRYRDFTGTPPEGVEPVIRIKAPTSGMIRFVDGVKGPIEMEAAQMVDDFIIARSDGTPTYNFVAALDDALMGVTDVIRGDDHLSNTPKQIIIYQALGLPLPRFFHVPMILNEEGKKLSKRDGAMDVMEYKTAGYLPEALLNFLVRLGWSNGDQEIFSKEEMLALFDPNHINKSASAYNLGKLEWLNTHYIKNASVSYICELLHAGGVDIADHDQKELLVDTLRERAKNVNEFVTMAQTILHTPTAYEAKACEKFLDSAAMAMLERFSLHLQSEPALHLPVEFEASANRFMEAHSLKLKTLAQPVRIALVGSAVSPSVFEVMAIIGHPSVIGRIEKLVKEKTPCPSH